MSEIVHKYKSARASPPTLAGPGTQAAFRAGVLPGAGTGAAGRAAGRSLLVAYLYPSKSFRAGVLPGAGAGPPGGAAGGAADRVLAAGGGTHLQLPHPPYRPVRRLIWVACIWAHLVAHRPSHLRLAWTAARRQRYAACAAPHPCSSRKDSHYSPVICLVEAHLTCRHYQVPAC